MGMLPTIAMLVVFSYRALLPASMESNAWAVVLISMPMTKGTLDECRSEVGAVAGCTWFSTSGLRMW
jgi:hypothetical protein